jgi:hypothetical protein
MELLYVFSDEFIQIMEVKRLDLPPGSAVKDVYQWIVYFIETNSFTPLSFTSMSQGVHKQERKFSQGRLIFDDQQANFYFEGKFYELLKSPQKHSTADLENYLGINFKELKVSLQTKIFAS